MAETNPYVAPRVISPITDVVTGKARRQLIVWLALSGLLSPILSRLMGVVFISTLAHMDEAIFLPGYMGFLAAGLFMQAWVVGALVAGIICCFGVKTRLAGMIATVMNIAALFL